MSDLRNDQDISKESLNEMINGALDDDPFASLNKLLDGNPEFKSIYDTMLSALSDDYIAEELDNDEYVEIDGRNYFVSKRIEIGKNTYLFLVNEKNVLDLIIQKVIIKEGEEYVTGLDSDKEFDLVQAYLQRDILMRLKRKIEEDKGDMSDN